MGPRNGTATGLEGEDGARLWWASGGVERAVLSVVIWWKPSREGSAERWAMRERPMSVHRFTKLAHF